jgi:hypothetical protein
MFPLDNFEPHIDAKILARGIAYHQDQAVDNLEETSPGKWAAVVSGSANYEVDVQVKDKAVINWQCDCPYDGPICKHVVAVLFTLREEMPADTKKKKRKNRKMGFEDILLKLDIEELRAFIRHQKKQEREFGEQFMLFFADKNPNMDVEKTYRNMIRQLVKKHSSRGYMDYKSTFDFSKAMFPILQTADHALSRNNFREALAIGQVISLEAMNLITMADDSAGNIGSTIADGIEIMTRAVDTTEVASETLEQLFAWLQRQLKDPVWFDYGDFGYDLLEIAAAIAPRVDADEFLHLLNKIQAAQPDDSYTLKIIKQQRIRFLQAIGRKQEAEQLIAANMDIVEIRLNVVNEAIAQKDFLRAKQLIAEGITLAEEKGHPGTVKRWEEVLLQIAQEENDMDTFRFFTRRFAFDRIFNEEYYQQWKDSFSPEEWPDVIEQHIQTVIAEEKSKPRKFVWDTLERALFSRLSPIYIAEQQWERLVQLIPDNPGGGTLSILHPHLAKRYPAEMLAYYLVELDHMASEASNRKAYQRLAGLMKKIKQDIKGSHSTIDELALSLIKRYPRRPAMREELGKVLKMK